MADKRRPKPQAEDIDPGVEELAALVQRSRMTDKQIAEKVSAARNHAMSPETVRSLRELETRRPQNYTITWIGWAIGKRRVWENL